MGLFRPNDRIDPFLRFERFGQRKIKRDSFHVLVAGVFHHGASIDKPHQGNPDRLHFALPRLLPGQEISFKKVFPLDSDQLGKLARELSQVPARPQLSRRNWCTTDRNDGPEVLYSP